jgi:hypothetical protein
VGHTIVVSRGLIDVLPDEASLAMVLAHELGHIVLGHRLDTKFSFSDRMLFGDDETFKRFRFGRDAREEIAADQKAAELLEASPYKDKMQNASLFVKVLNARSKQLPNLIRPHLGSQLAASSKRFAASRIASSAPALDMKRTDQIAALPLGGRIKVDPWNSRIELLKNKPLVLLSAREKMPFEVTPFRPYLVRLERPAVASPPATGTRTPDRAQKPGANEPGASGTPAGDAPSTQPHAQDPGAH